MDDIRLNALEDLLRPIAEFCLRHSLKFQDIQEFTKVAFVNAAEARLTALDEKVTASQLSLITGLQRREVNRITNTETFGQDRWNPIIDRVIGQWEGDMRFRTKEGKPKVLSCDGVDSEFHELVRVVTRSVNPATVLRELTRLKLAEMGPRGIRLIKGGGDLSKDWLGAMNMAARDFETLMEAVEQNVERGRNDWNLHLRTEYDNIYAKDIPKIREWLINHGKEFHRAARHFLAQYDRDITPGSSSEAAGIKVALQAFSLIIEPAEGTEQKKTAA